MTLSFDPQAAMEYANKTGRVDFQRERDVFVDHDVPLDTPAAVLAAFLDEEAMQHALGLSVDPPLSRSYHLAVADEYRTLCLFLLDLGIVPDPAVMALLAGEDDDDAPPTSCGVCASTDVQLWIDDDDRPSHYYCNFCGQHLAWAPGR